MQVAMVIGGLPKHYLGVIKARPQSSWSYNGRNFNVQGDESAHWEITPPGCREHVDLQADNVSLRAIDDLVGQIRGLESRGCRVMLLWPTTIRSNFEAYVPVVNRLEREFASRGVLFANEPQTFVHPDSLAFDTRYHMSRPAVEVNTEKIISLLSADMRGRGRSAGS